MSKQGDATTDCKVVLITGCSENSIGEAIAKQFLKRNYHVIATARSLARLQSLQSLGAQTVEFDATSTEAIQSLRRSVTRLDILVNNAGQSTQGLWAETSSAQLRQEFAVNLFSVHDLTQALLPLLLESKGIIMNHTSMQAYIHGPLASVYAASKAALSSLTDTMRLELKPFGVRVVELVTGIVDTPILERMKGNKIQSNSIYLPIKDTIEFQMQATGVARTSTPDEYAVQVVSDLLDGWWTPVWIWRGAYANIAYCLWFAGCHWKGINDVVWMAPLGFTELAKKIREKKTKVT